VAKDGKLVDLSSLESGSTETRELARVASDVALSEVFDESTIHDLAYLKHRLSEEVARSILKLFRISTITMTALVAALALVDGAFVYQSIIEPSERLINGSVIMSVIGATIVQVGAASLAIVYSLFKGSTAAIHEEGESKRL
jgi:hypothetical protein